MLPLMRVRATPLFRTRMANRPLLGLRRTALNGRNGAQSGLSQIRPSVPALKVWGQRSDLPLPIVGNLTLPDEIGCREFSGLVA